MPEGRNRTIVIRRELPRLEARFLLPARFALHDRDAKFRFLPQCVSAEGRGINRIAATQSEPERCQQSKLCLGLKSIIRHLLNKTLRHVTAPGISAAVTCYAS